MQRYSLSHLADHALLGGLAAVDTQVCAKTAELLAHLAEVDARKLYLPAAYPSLFAYCVGERRWSEDTAFKRIKAARAARRFPAIFAALAGGRLHLSAVVMLAPHLTAENASALLGAATHKSKSEIEQLLSERFPQPDVLDWVETTPSSSLTPSAEEQTQGPVGDLGPFQNERAPGPVRVPLSRASGGDRPRVKPLSPESFVVQFTLSRTAHDKLRYARDLLSHQVPTGDIAGVVERALDALIPQLEKRKFAATAKPRTGQRRPSASPRHIPAQVKRTVWERDGGQCTFVSEVGHRCEARSRIDHVREVARGGEATVAGIRLRCRLCRYRHNRHYAASGFMPRWCAVPRLRQDGGGQAR